MKRLNLMLLLVAAVLTLSTITRAQSVTKTCVARQFFAVNESGREHIALSALSAAVKSAAVDSCSEFYTACDKQAGDLNRDCQYRGEGAGPYDYSFTSCNCQALREFRRCMQDNGCGHAYALQFDLEQHPDCFGIQ